MTLTSAELPKAENPRKESVRLFSANSLGQYEVSKRFYTPIHAADAFEKQCYWQTVILHELFRSYGLTYLVARDTAFADTLAGLSHTEEEKKTRYRQSLNFIRGNSSLRFDVESAAKAVVDGNRAWQQNQDVNALIQGVADWHSIVFSLSTEQSRVMRKQAVHYAQGEMNTVRFRELEKSGRDTGNITREAITHFRSFYGGLHMILKSR